MMVMSNSGAAAAAWSTHIRPAPPLPITAMSVVRVSTDRLAVMDSLEPPPA
jgi:hypothetical protein